MYVVPEKKTLHETKNVDISWGANLTEAWASKEGAGGPSPPWILKLLAKKIVFQF